MIRDEPRRSKLERAGNLGLRDTASIHDQTLIFKIPNYRTGTRRFFVEKPEWICFVDHMSVMPRNDVIFVQRTFGDAGDEILQIPELSRGAAGVNLCSNC